VLGGGGGRRADAPSYSQSVSVEKPIEPTLRLTTTSDGEKPRGAGSTMAEAHGAARSSSARRRMVSTALEAPLGAERAGGQGE